MTKLAIKKILNKKNKAPITCLSVYSKTLAQIADKYCDIILVGDSLGMVLYGMKTTKSVTMDTMILHTKTVKRFAKKSLVVFDMPYATYENKHMAYRNAKKVIKLTKCDAVKLEGGKNISPIVKYLTNNGIPVMGHIGLLPQTTRKFKVKGKNLNQKKNLLEDAINISSAGAFAVVLECIVENVAKKITKSISIPTIGIGASKYCDGQILVVDDLLGLSDFKPKFVKKYSDLRKLIESSIKSYTKDVKLKKFPSSINVYK
tara:strand:+ start:159 stop:938 length:780 start_codon:yes stop_codon:yes gene_type:complete